MLRFLVRLLLGYYCFTIQTASPVRVVNKLQQKGIGFWKPKVSDTGVKLCCMKSSGAELCRLVSDMGITDVKVKSIGLPFLLSTLPRKILFWGILLLLVAVPLVSGRFLAEIRVLGNSSVETDAILHSLEESGVKPYAYIPNLELKQSRQQLLLQQPKLSWATLNLKGNALEVIVHEKSGSQVIRPTEPCNIVAAYDGFVCKAEVLSGKQMVKENTAVRKGQLLVSGFSETETGHLSYLHAQATVMAEVELQKSYTVNLAANDYRALDDVLTRYELTAFGMTLPLYTAGQLPKQPYTVQVDQQKAKIFGIILPFGLTRRSYTLYEKTKATLTEADAEEILKQRFAEYELYELEDCIIIGKDYSLKRSGRKITMTGSYLVQTDIAQKVLIEVVE